MHCYPVAADNRFNEDLSPNQMATDSATAVTPPPRAGTWRWIVVGLLFLFEYLLISLIFEVQPLRGQPGLAGLLGYADIFVPIMLAAVAVLIFLADDTLRLDLREVMTARVGWFRFLGSLIAQLFAWFVFLLTTIAMFGESGGLERDLRFKLSLWLTSGTITGLLLLNAVVPLRRVVWFLRRHANVLLIALAAGAVALFTARVSEELWEPLSTMTLLVVVAILQLFSSNVLIEPDPPAVGLGEFAVIIDHSCSGYEGVGLMLVFLGVYMWSQRQSLRFPQVLWLLPIAVATTYRRRETPASAQRPRSPSSCGR